MLVRLQNELEGLTPCTGGRTAGQQGPIGRSRDYLRTGRGGLDGAEHEGPRGSGPTPAQAGVDGECFPMTGELRRTTPAPGGADSQETQLLRVCAGLPPHRAGGGSPARPGSAEPAGRDSPRGGGADYSWRR